MPSKKQIPLFADKAPGRRRYQIGQLVTRAEVQGSSLNEEARTIDIVWTTGAKVLRQQFFGESYYEELSLEPEHVRMGRLNSGAPLLDSHDIGSTDAVIGVIERAEIGEGKGVATVRFGTDERSEKVFAKVRDGILRSVSVGYRVYKLEKIEDSPDATGPPVMRATDWEPVEISMVPVGADGGASIRGNDNTKNDCEVIMQTRGATLGGLLEELRDEAEMTNEELGAAAGISDGTVSQIIAGEIDCPPMERLEGFAEALNVSVDRLVAAAEEDGCTFGEEEADEPSDEENALTRGECAPCKEKRMAEAQGGAAPPDALSAVRTMYEAERESHDTTKAQLAVFLKREKEDRAAQLDSKIAALYESGKLVKVKGKTRDPFEMKLRTWAKAWSSKDFDEYTDRLASKVPATRQADDEDATPRTGAKVISISARQTKFNRQMYPECKTDEEANEKHRANIERGGQM